MRKESGETVIIGAGIHGVSTALALASRGRRSLILEAGEAPFTGASVRNEGKVHLGFVYALDETGATTPAMVDGSLAFAPLIQRWCGEVDWGRIRSAPFAYVTMDQGLAGPDQLESHYRFVLEEMGRAAPEFGTSYLGVDVNEAEISRHDEVFPGMDQGLSSCWFETPERSVHPHSVAALLERAVAREPKIEILTGHRVDSAQRLDGGFRLEVETQSGARRIEAENVVNCAWEGRPALDRMILGEGSAANFRVKHSVTIRGGETGSIGAVTMAQGPFGDVVPWPSGEIYINWYPNARTHFGDRPLDKLEPDRDVAVAVHKAVSELFPALADFSLDSYGPCYILAEGQTDISDPDSRLHSRAGAVFLESDGWWSIRSSKLTTAPLAGERCAAAITGSEVEI